MNRPLTGSPAAGLILAPLTPRIVAKVGGVDLAEPLAAETVAAIRADLDWKLLFFRDQETDIAQHLAFARGFGDLEVHPFAPHTAGYPEPAVRRVERVTIIGGRPA